MSRYPGAAWRPLPEQASEGPNTPRLLIFHTMVGSQNGTEQWFRREDVKTESHFGIAMDGTSDDPVRQWVDTDREADTNWDANGISVTVELEDRGDPSRPLTPFQIDECIRLGVWACRTHDIPAVLAAAPDGSGLGWHQLFTEWNRSSHACPGPVRRKQLAEIVFPAIAALVTRQELWMEPIWYAQRGSVDYGLACWAAEAIPGGNGAPCCDLDQVKRAARAGARVVAVGGPAVRDLAGVPHTAAAGKDAKATGQAVLDLLP